MGGKTVDGESESDCDDAEEEEPAEVKDDDPEFLKFIHSGKMGTKRDDMEEPIFWHVKTAKFYQEVILVLQHWLRH